MMTGHIVQKKGTIPVISIHTRLGISALHETSTCFGASRAKYL